MAQAKDRQDQPESSTPLPGFPGYRTRPGRTGLDPLDNNREAARAEGLFYRKLFTMQLRTRNPFYLTLMAVFGLPLLILPILFITDALINGLDQPWFNTALGLLWLLIPVVLSVFLLTNFTINLVHILRPQSQTSPLRKASRSAHKKKMRHHRKDYR
jgi:hypothetical protein